MILWYNDGQLHTTATRGATNTTRCLTNHGKVTSMTATAIVSRPAQDAIPTPPLNGGAA